MDYGPTEREEDDAVTLETQVVKLAHEGPVGSLKLGENNLNLDFDELAAPSIGNSEFEARPVAIRSDNSIAAINNSCRGPRKSAEDDACGECDPENVDQRLNRDESISGDSYRDDVAVSDRRKSVDAEKNAL